MLRRLRSPKPVFVHRKESEEDVAILAGVVRGGHEEPENHGSHHDKWLPPPPLAKASQGLGVVGLAFFVALLRESGDRKLGLDEAQNVRFPVF